MMAMMVVNLDTDEGDEKVTQSTGEANISRTRTPSSVSAKQMRKLATISGTPQIPAMQRRSAIGEPHGQCRLAIDRP